MSVDTIIKLIQLLGDLEPALANLIRNWMEKKGLDVPAVEAAALKNTDEAIAFCTAELQKLGYE